MEIVYLIIGEVAIITRKSRAAVSIESSSRSLHSAWHSLRECQTPVGMTPQKNAAQSAHFGTFHRLIMLIRLFFASICMYNPARLDFI